jgi:hypothetical protein
LTFEFDHRLELKATTVTETSGSIATPGSSGTRANFGEAG